MRVNKGNVDLSSQVQNPEGSSGGCGPIYVHDGVVPLDAGAVVVDGNAVVDGTPLALRFGIGNGPLTSLHAALSRALMMSSADAGSAR